GAAQDNAVAYVVVTLPEDAQLYFDGSLTTQVGDTRTFVTPPLQAGSTYSYQLKAEALRGGKVVSQSRQIQVKAGQTTRLSFDLGAGPAAESAADGPPQGDAGWARKFTADGYTNTVYQPPVEKWEQNRLEARAAVAIETKASPQPDYGVALLTARTEVDKENQQVTLEDIRVAKADFPTAGDRAKEYLE